jgi:antitoxin MazE
VAEVFLDIKNWGNNLGVRLPAAVARAARLKADQRVRVSVNDAPLTLTQRLARFDPARHGGETMVTSERQGAEQW